MDVKMKPGWVEKIVRAKTTFYFVTGDGLGWQLYEGDVRKIIFKNETFYKNCMKQFINSVEPATERELQAYQEEGIPIIPSRIVDYDAVLHPEVADIKATVTKGVDIKEPIEEIKEVIELEKPVHHKRKNYNY